MNRGVAEGDEVVLNPIAYVEEAKKQALRPFRGVTSKASDEQEPDTVEDQEVATADDADLNAEESRDTGEPDNPAADTEAESIE